MISDDVLKSVRYVVDQEGHKAAVQVDIKDWLELLDYLEDLEDRFLLREKLVRLKNVPDPSSAVSWDEAKGEW
jgi:uncharacterized protein YehS (DUF1456 family)